MFKADGCWIGLKDSDPINYNWTWSDGSQTNYINIDESSLSGVEGADCITIPPTGSNGMLDFWSNYVCDYTSGIKCFACNLGPTTAPTNLPTHTPTQNISSTITSTNVNTNTNTNINNPSTTHTTTGNPTAGESIASSTTRSRLTATTRMSSSTTEEGDSGADPLEADPGGLDPEASSIISSFVWTLFGCTVCLSLTAYLHSSDWFSTLGCGFVYKHSPIVDDCKPFNVFYAFFQILDLYSDCLLCYEIVSEALRDDHSTNVEWPWMLGLLAILSPLFVFVPYITNVIYTLRWNKNQALSQFTAQWLLRNSAFFATIVALTGGVYPSVELVNSKMFGYYLFHMGLSKQELTQFARFRLFSNVIGEVCLFVCGTTILHCFCV